MLKSGKLYQVRHVGKASEQEIVKYLSENEYDCSFLSDCEVCNLANYKEYALDNLLYYELADANYLDLSMFYDKVRKAFFLRATGEDFADYPIKHCPNCGRKLF